ncbi:hypothetical protein F3Y22_tig00110930pilonHSYRG00133 [Hibiscus syriacus]|uniref:Uncharacterized protein n=1 Tax=Hibiscus syriacus TaxID=106335 RepID=A0A6A2ZEI3_HIBSY|nr:hypothetical protein F3Y22_tig00110930pilonHSYRG00133 [Hibiscus syriacus]
MLSPINMNFAPKSNENPLLQASLSGRMSPQNVEPMSPMSSPVSILVQCEKKKQFRSLSSRELGSGSTAIVGSPVNSWWGSSDGKPDWAVNADRSSKLHRSSPFELGNGDDPDLSWAVDEREKGCASFEIIPNASTSVSPSPKISPKPSSGILGPPSMALPLPLAPATVVALSQERPSATLDLIYPLNGAASALSSCKVLNLGRLEIPVQEVCMELVDYAGDPKHR